MSQSVDPHRLDADGDIHVVSDQLRAGHHLIPGDAEVTSIHRAGGLERDPLSCPSRSFAIPRYRPESVTGFECPLMVRIPFTSTVLSATANPVPLKVILG